MNETPKIVGFGEILLRIKSQGHERMLQSPLMEVRFGGSEYNVLASLAQFGMDTSFVSAVPDNELGAACLTEVRAKGVGVDQVLISGGRFGLYFMETGAAQRPTNILYDREDSAFSRLRLEDIEWALIFENCNWFHLSGITPSLNARLTKLSLAAISEAKKRNIPVSFDFNFRKKLWEKNQQPASEIFPEIVGQVDILFASERDCTEYLGVSNQKAALDSTGGFFALTEQMFDAFPNLSVMTSTFRQHVSADHNNLAAGLRSRDGYFISPTYEMPHIVDRIGGGDAFAAGVIYGLMTQAKGQRVINFATAAACLKHTIPGDVNRATVFEVEELMRGHSVGRVNR